MYSVGDKILYGENGVCTVERIAPLDMDMDGIDNEKIYYHLRPVVGSGLYYTPVDSGAFTRPVIGREEAEQLLESIPDIEPAICNDRRFNHVDAFYKEFFKLHSCEAMVSVIKGLSIRIAERKTKSSRIDATMKKAKEILHAELSIALDIPYDDVEDHIKSCIGSDAEALS